MSDFGEFPIIQVCAGSNPRSGNQPPVRLRVLFLHDRRMREIAAQAGAVHFQLLLLGMALGEQRQIVTRSQLIAASPPRLRSLHRLLQNPLGQRHDVLQIRRRRISRSARCR